MKSSLLMILLLPPFVQAGNHWNTILPGGNMRFQGEIISESCRVEAGDTQMAINMGAISSNRFHYSGADANPVPFDIHLLDCNTAVSQRVGIAFHGVADDKNPDVLSIDEGIDTARGVGIALFDANNQFIPLNAAPRSWAQLYTGPVTLHFVAKYRATEQHVNGGKANAQVWFSLTYL